MQNERREPTSLTAGSRHRARPLRPGRLPISFLLLFGALRPTRAIAALASGRSVDTIPFQVPDFALSINLKTAQAIGLEIDESVQDAADVVVR